MSSKESARPPRATGTCCRRIATASAILVSALIIGCASAPSASDLILNVSADRETYRIGDPLVATVQLRNKTDHVVNVPRFDAKSLKFMYGKKGQDARIRRDPVHSRAIAPRPRTVEPGSFVSRQFLFTRMTAEDGDYGLIVGFKGAVADETVIDETIYSEPTQFRVSEEIGLKRDKANGLVLKSQAIELARAKAGGEVTFARAVLVELGKSGLFTWVVMLTEKRPQDRVRKYAVRVDAYTGKVRPLPLKGPPSVAAAKVELEEQRKETGERASIRTEPDATPRSRGVSADNEKLSPEGGGSR